MTIVDTIAYRTEPYEGMQKKNEFVRIVGGYIFAVILTVISVIFAVMANSEKEGKINAQTEL